MKGAAPLGPLTETSVPCRDMTPTRTGGCGNDTHAGGGGMETEKERKAWAQDDLLGIMAAHIETLPDRYDGKDLDAVVRKEKEEFMRAAKLFGYRAWPGIFDEKGVK